MRDIALVETGARLSQASSHHSDFPPTNIIDKRTTKPWISTGLYPQYFVVSFPELMQIQSIKISAKNVKLISVERSTTERIANYEEVVEKTLAKSDKMTEEILTSEEVTAQHLKFTIKSGYGHFIGVFSVEVMGSLASGRSPSRMMRKTQSAMPVSKSNVQQDMDEDEEVEGNNKRRRRFQSAFRVPNSNRPSQDHSHMHEIPNDLDESEFAEPLKEDSIIDDDEEDEDIDDDDEDDTYMRRQF